MLRRVVIRTRAALILSLAAWLLAAPGCSEPPRIGGQTVADCIAGLGEPGNARRLAALHTLAAFGADADGAVDAVASRLVDPALAEAAVATLSAIGTPNARDALRRALIDADLSRTAVTAAATACAPSLGHAELRRVLAQIVDERPGRAAELLSHEALWAGCADGGAARRAAANALAAPERVERLQRRELDELSRHVISHPADFDDPVSVLVMDLDRQPVRPDVLGALGRSGDPRALDAILARCRSPWPAPLADWFGAAAASAEGDVDRQARVLAALRDALDAAELPVRLAAIEALGALGARAGRVSPTRREVTARLAEAARDARPAIESAAREAWLTLPGEADAVALSITRDPDLDRARRAIHALGSCSLPDEVILPALTLITAEGPPSLAASVARAASARSGGVAIQIRALLGAAEPDVDADVIRAVTAWAQDPRVDDASLARAAADATDTRRATPLLDALAARLAKAGTDAPIPSDALEAVVADAGAEPERRARLLGWLCRHARNRAALPVDTGSTRSSARVLLARATARLDFQGTRGDLPALIVRSGKTRVRLAHLGDRTVFRVEQDGQTTPIPIDNPEGLALSETDDVVLVLTGKADGMGPSVRPPELAVLRILRQ
jgi:hypothetical protein